MSLSGLLVLQTIKHAGRLRTSGAEPGVGRAAKLPLALHLLSPFPLPPPPRAVSLGQRRLQRLQGSLSLVKRDDEVVDQDVRVVQSAEQDV